MTLLPGDATEPWALDDCTLDSIVTDPPYGIGFLGTDWDDKRGYSPKTDAGRRALAACQMLGYEPWQSGFVAFTADWSAQAYRCLKPGGFCLAFAGARNADLLAMGLRAAGFEVTDTIEWLYLSGLTKAQDLGKMFDRQAGAQRQVIGQYVPPDGRQRNAANHADSRGTYGHGNNGWAGRVLTAPATKLARVWDGWTTPNLKPAHEPILVARRPLTGTYCENIEEWGVGGFHTAACRIPADAPADKGAPSSETPGTQPTSACEQEVRPVQGAPGPKGRFPANVVTLEERQWFSTYFNVTPRELSRKPAPADRHAGCEHLLWRRVGTGYQLVSQYEWALLPKTERAEGNIHPTLKDTALVRWLQRLATPPGGLTGSPFLGSGTDAVAAALEGFQFWGLNLPDRPGEEYWPIIGARTTYAIQSVAATPVPPKQRTLFDPE